MADLMISLENEDLKMVAKNRAEAMSVQQMQTFCSVYEHGGYAGAEQHLELAPPTLWEQVKVLEKIYRAKLFERAGRNIRPTTAGDTLYQILKPLLATVDSSFEILAEESGQALRQIRLVTGVRMMLEELGVPLKRFRDAHPDVSLRLMTADNRTSQAYVLEGKADVALMIEPPPSMRTDGITYQRLYTIEYLAVFPKRHRLARKSMLRLADLAGEPLIVGNSNTVGRQLLEQAVVRLDLTEQLRIVAETDNSASTVACVRAGMGVGFIAGRSDGNLTRPLACRSLAEEIGQVFVVAAYRQGRQLTRALTEMLRLLSCA